MVLLFIIFLQLISTALWLTTSGLAVQKKLRHRVNSVVSKTANELNTPETKGVIQGTDKVRNTANNVLDTTNKVASKSLKLVRTVINVIKYALMALLPLIFVFDLIVFGLLALIASVAVNFS